jgi:hypothetical protein
VFIVLPFRPPSPFAHPQDAHTCADLYFSFGDLVSTHLLISAAHEILDDFDKKISKTGLLIEAAELGIKSEYVEEYRHLLKTPFLGFKHGAKDVDAVIELLRASPKY